MKLANVFGGLLHPAEQKPDPAQRAVQRLAKGGAPARELDLLLIWSAVALLLLGLVMVYSASIAFAEGSRFTGYQSHYFLMRHAVFLAIGIGLGLVSFQLPMARWQQLAPALFVAGVVLLIVVLIPGVGREVNGAQRWLSLGPVNLQPSELMKIFAALYAADYTVRKLDVMGSFIKGFLPMLVVILFVGFLLLREPDFGAFVVITTIAFGVLFLGGLNVRVFGLLAVLALIGFVILIWTSPYRRDRIFGFMDPWQDAFGKGYQLSHSLIAFGRGEWFGVGLGGSVEKLFYLPEAHTDFLLAVIAEELGFVGVLTVVVLFAIIVQRAFLIGREAIRLERYFSGLVAQGIGLWIGVQSFINMGVNMGLLPTKGLTLPLMSFGGSGIVANCIALGILLRIDWEVRQLKRGATP
ncbi:putative lipid II flippase FtsW [Thauera mechernichensis]|uniref:Probable peptidoglycan glycosyltransferase FtsW n=1 Tax=Thauera mechernichensis TaxID=82788 RepID=A0ABW3WD07_9RHOO|nr:MULTISPECIES: putative lipid II flippase FtsW [Thauera]ENO82615.1 cell division protein FtsW [Thauera sp. 27]ENO93418.1 cell division protein FtsW [Thauera sp. 28]MDG3065956.1 putative lipid II flippase FtsW [Thauera mechernichensis]WBL65186.1 putative lipid II flippase FtsW [Thauera sp. WB-2]HNR59652.1 putative lipid II flippase FtsW [Thauera sp.]